MNRKNIHIVLVLIVMVAVGMVSCSTGEPDKIPITTKSEDALRYFLTGRDLTERLRRSEAELYFDSALSIDPDFALAHVYMAQVQQSTQNVFEHLKEAQALKDKTSEGESLIIEGLNQAVQGNTMNQIEVYRRLVKLYPEDERALLLLGATLYGIQEYEEALKLFRQSSEVNPDYSPAYNMEGYTYRALGDFDNAALALLKYIEKIPDDPNPYDSYADLLLKIGQLDSSIYYYRRAIQVDSQFSPSYTGVATNLLIMGKHEEARAEVDLLLSQKINSRARRDAFLIKALVYIDESNIPAAKQELLSRLAVAEAESDIPTQVGDLFLLGNISFYSGSIDEAVAHCHRAQKLARKSDLPDELTKRIDRRHTFCMARAALARKDLATAKARFDKFNRDVESNGTISDLRTVHLLAGLIALHERDYDKAVQELTKANRESPFALFHLAQACQGQGELEKARSLFLEVSRFNQPGSMDFVLVRRDALALASGLSQQ